MLDDTETEQLINRLRSLSSVTAARKYNLMAADLLEEARKEQKGFTAAIVGWKALYEIEKEKSEKAKFGRFLRRVFSKDKAKLPKGDSKSKGSDNVFRSKGKE